jgi:predicted nucleic acid-binding protein
MSTNAIWNKQILFDTNIVIYLLYRVQYAELYIPYTCLATPVICFMTVAELYEGAFRAGKGTKKFNKIVDELKKYEILECTPLIAEKFGEIRAASRNRPLSVPDALIAATALAYDLPLVTHNAEHFAGIDGLNVITEYKKGK